MILCTMIHIMPEICSQHCWWGFLPLFSNININRAYEPICCCYLSPVSPSPSPSVQLINHMSPTHLLSQGLITDTASSRWFWICFKKQMQLWSISDQQAFFIPKVPECTLTSLWPNSRYSCNTHTWWSEWADWVVASEQIRKVISLSGFSQSIRDVYADAMLWVLICSQSD